MQKTTEENKEKAKTAETKLERVIWIILGYITLALGIIGAILPVIPGAPFIILSAYCFSKGSQKMHDALRANKLSGPIINDWEQNRVIRPKAKIMFVVLVTASLVVVYRNERIPEKLKYGVTATVIIVGSWILTRPNRPKKQDPS